MRLFVILVLLISSLSACKPKVTSMRDPASLGASSGVPRYWRSSSLPLQVRVADEFFLTDFPALGHGDLNPFEQMMQAWDSQVNVQLFQINDLRTTNLQSFSLDTYDDNEIGIYRLDNWFPNVTTDALAIAQYFFLRRNVGRSNEYNEIIHADIMINYQTYNFYLDHTANKNNKYDLKTVVLHELGHLIGLDHLSGSAVMNAFLSLGEEKRAPLLNDRVAIKNIYQPGPSSLILAGMNDSQGSTEPHPEEGVRGRGVIELLKSGECRHYENGVLVHTHPSTVINH